MDETDKLLFEALMLDESFDDPPVPLTDEIRALIRATPIETKPKVLNAKAMRLVILETLHYWNRPASGPDVVQWLKEKNLEFEIKGSGAIFALLYRLEVEGKVQMTLDEHDRLPRYEIARKGSTLLEKDAQSVFDGLGLTHLWSAQ